VLLTLTFLLNAAAFGVGCLGARWAR